VSHNPPTADQAPPRPRGLGRRLRGSGRRLHGTRRAVLILVAALPSLATGCARPDPANPSAGATESGGVGPESSVAAGVPALDGLLVATGGQLLASDADGALIAFEPAPDRADAVTASAGVIVVTDAAGETMLLDTTAPARVWETVELTADLPGSVRLTALAPSGRELAIVTGDPQGSSFALGRLDLRTGTSKTISVTRGLNGPPSWLGPGTVAVDVIRNAGQSGIAMIDLRTGVVADQPGPATMAVSSLDGGVLAIDDSASGDVLIGDLASWLAGGAATMRRIQGPPSTGVEALAMSADGMRLAIVRRSDAGGTVAVVVRTADEWRTVRTLTMSGDAPIAVAWLR
jgi:hypothetical protein